MFKKILNLKTISIFISLIFLFTSVSFGIISPSLRSPLIFRDRDTVTILEKTWTFNEEERKVAIELSGSIFWTEREKTELGNLLREAGLWMDGYEIETRIQVPVYEAAINIMTHGKGGEVQVYFTKRKGVLERVEIVCIDRGPGIDDPNEPFRKSRRVHESRDVISAEFGPYELDMLDAEHTPRKLGFANIVPNPDDVIIEAKDKKWIRVEEKGWGITIIDPGNAPLAEEFAAMHKNRKPKYKFAPAGPSSVNQGTRITLIWRNEEGESVPKDIDERGPLDTAI